jgi:hypothetical protein
MLIWRVQSAFILSREHPVKLCRNLLWFVFLAATFAATGAHGGELNDAKFRKLHKELQPGDEPWRTIPWKISLLNAQKLAAVQRKPIFIWAMDGHPLGCT